MNDKELAKAWAYQVEIDRDAYRTSQDQDQAAARYILATQVEPTIPPAGCGINPLSSGVCDRGTKCCVVEHSAPTRIDALQSEMSWLHTWPGILSTLNKFWPEDVFPTKGDDPDRDDGPRIASLLRRVGHLTKEREEARAAAAEVDRSGGDAPHEPCMGLAAWIRSRDALHRADVDRLTKERNEAREGEYHALEQAKTLTKERDQLRGAIDAKWVAEKDGELNEKPAAEDAEMDAAAENAANECINHGEPMYSTASFIRLLAARVKELRRG